MTFAPGCKVSSFGVRTFQATPIIEITIPANLKTITTGYTFYNCDQLKTVNFEAGTQLEAIVSNMFYGTAITEFIIPDGA